MDILYGPNASFLPHETAMRHMHVRHSHTTKACRMVATRQTSAGNCQHLAVHRLACNAVQNKTKAIR